MSGDDDYSVAKFYTNVWLNGAVLASSLFLFCVLRRFGPQVVRRFYSPFRRQTAVEQGQPFPPPSNSRENEEEGPDNSVLHWTWRVFWLREDEVFARHGEDGIMYLRFLRMCLLLCCMMMTFSCIVLLPIHITADNEDDTQDMGVLTMSNIPKRSDKFIAHIVFTYLFSFIFYGAIVWVFRSYATLRASYLTANCVRIYTLLVRNIPPELHSKRTLRDWFKSRLNAPAVALNFIRKTSKLQSLKKKRAKLFTKMSKAAIREEHYARYTGYHSWKTLLCFCREKVEPAAFYQERIEQLDAEIEELQRNKKRTIKKGSTCFVTLSTSLFNRMRMAPFVDPTSMTISPAPSPTDVNWKQLFYSYLSHVLRMTFITAVLIVVSLGWTIPQTFIVSLAHLSSLQEVPKFGWISDSITSGIHPSGAAILEGFLPAIVITVMGMLVKHFFRFAYTHFGGLPSYSMAEWYAMIMYSFFLFLNVFIIVGVEGTLFQALAQLIDDPGQTVSLLAESLPQQALFFTVFIMVQIGRLPISLFRIKNLLLSLCAYIHRARPLTNSERREMLSTGEFDFISGYSNGLLVFTITLCYGVMAPLTCVFGFLFYALSLVIDGYDLRYATEQRWQGGGKAFSFAFHHFMGSYFVFQIIMIAILGLSEYGGGAALIPLPIFTLALWIFMHFGWTHVINYGPVDSAACESNWQDSISEERMKNAYRQPALEPLHQELEEQTSEEVRKNNHHYKDEREEEEERAKIENFQDQHLRFATDVFPGSDGSITRSL